MEKQHTTGQVAELGRSSSDTTTEDLSEEVREEFHQIEERDSHDSAWEDLQANFNLRHCVKSKFYLDDSIFNNESDRFEVSGSSKCDQTMLHTILERVDRPRMAVWLLEAFTAMQKEGKFNVEGMKNVVRYWEKLSSLCGRELTQGMARVFASMLDVKLYNQKEEILVRCENHAHFSDRARHDPFPSHCSSAEFTRRKDIALSVKSRAVHFAEEFKAMEEGSERLKTSQLFRELDDKRTGLMLIEIDHAQNRVVMASNQAYLTILPDPFLLFIEGMARCCLPLFLSTAFIAHTDREVWLRMNLEAISEGYSLSGARNKERGKRGKIERRLNSGFVKICSLQGVIHLYLVQFSAIESMRTTEVEGGIEKVLVALRIEQVPFSRHITDQPEKRKTHGKALFYRQRPSSASPEIRKRLKYCCYTKSAEGTFDKESDSRTVSTGQQEADSFASRTEDGVQGLTAASSVLAFPALASIPYLSSASLETSFPHKSIAIACDHVRMRRNDVVLPLSRLSSAPSTPRLVLTSPICTGTSPISTCFPPSTHLGLTALFQVKSEFLRSLLSFVQKDISPATTVWKHPLKRCLRHVTETSMTHIGARQSNNDNNNRDDHHILEDQQRHPVQLSYQRQQLQHQQQQKPQKLHMSSSSPSTQGQYQLFPSQRMREQGQVPSCTLCHQKDHMDGLLMLQLAAAHSSSNDSSCV